MVNLYRNNMIAKIIAVLLAVLLWIYVNADQNPPTETTLNVNVVYSDLREDFVLTQKVKTVAIKIRGDEKSLNNLGTKDFKATTDLAHVKLGEQSVEVKVKSPLGIEVLDIYPRKINIKVDKLAEKQVPVRVALLGQTAHGFSSFKASVKPSHVVIKGPKDLLATIVDARVDVNLDEADSNLVLSLPIKVKDKWDNVYGTETFVMNPSSVDVFVPIIKDTPSKTVPIKSVLTGKPIAGLRVGRVILEPETVRILGNFNKLDAIDYISTEPINITGITENTTREVELKLPSDISVLYSAKVKVMIQVEDKPLTKTLNREIKVRNLAEGKQVKVTPNIGNITIEGSKDVLNKISGKDLELFADITGLDNGEHEVEVSTNPLANVQILKVEPAKVKVTISDEETTEEDSKEETGEKQEEE